MALKAKKSKVEPIVYLGILSLFITLFFEIFFFTTSWVAVKLFTLFFALFACTLFLRSCKRKAILWEMCRLPSVVFHELIFQGAILFQPQLEYPGVEKEFLKAELHIPEKSVDGWLDVRSASALVTPLLLLSVGLFLFEFWAGMAASAVFLVSLFLRTLGSPRLFFSVCLGMAAVLLEAWVFVNASQMITPTSSTAAAFLLYSITLIAYELSPFPFALGTVEISYFALYLFPFQLPSIAIPLLYRFTRSLPVVILIVLLLPRYKLHLFDLYSPLLAQAFAKKQHKKDHNGEAKSYPYTLSIIIPAFNEADRLPAFLDSVLSYAQSVKGGAEVIVVNDGSSDGTQKFLSQSQKTYPFLKVLRHKENKGKGKAVQTGVLKAEGRHLLFVDADGSTAIKEANKLLEEANRGHDIVLGIRTEGDHVNRWFMRKYLGLLFYRITNLFALPGIIDTQCGFKLFSNETGKFLFSRLSENGWAFDIEILFIAQKMGMQIAQVPVEWSEVEGSKVRPIQDGLNMLISIFKIQSKWKGLIQYESTMKKR